jgi:hypothetical protein
MRSDHEAALRAVLKNPPIKAPFLYATNSSGLVNTSKYGVMQLHAAILAKQSPGVSFDSIANVAIAVDVSEALRVLARRLGHQIVASSICGIKGPMFSVVDDGQIFVIVRDAFANDLIGGTPVSRQAAAKVFRDLLLQMVGDPGTSGPTSAF